MSNRYYYRNQVDQGRIQVNVSVLDVGRPADAAVVRITPRNGENTVEEMMTNTSGQTPVTDLPAPPLEFSQVPGSPMPYSEYDIYVTMEGYKPVRVEGTQILPDTLAIQNVNLEPASAPPAGPEEVPIQPHTLYGVFPPKIPESEVKPLPDSSGFVVLPQPVVPEFVVVHLGVPTDSSARNVWVTFQDYIKNVASCEIYSTWPEETIKANVLAILSFTMNRIFTEWYRGRGFDFTITNSTAFDQAFNYGRNIYDNISNIVDDLFTTYITRPGIRQPLLTQYCDGTRVQCPGWLTQWGSKYLGDQGYDAISILRNFYGQDIFLMAADRVSGVPVSFPGAALQLGSTGPAVRTIQEQLNAISNNYPAISKVRVDGEFGEQTRVAVETFQRIFNMPITGIVDFATWYRISAIYVAVTRMAEL
ncbi:MAG: peptidoglycan-binding protein [Bacillota bacterium]|jgi:peptidoglycan hydrolase-like protein with peptidoglycan-binding domain|nr:peptidoglycan-binding protein [Bacillota bacterium]